MTSAIALPCLAEQSLLPMNQPTRNLTDGQTASGSMSTVRRAGDTVIRPAGPWSLAVHDLLHYLENRGFPYSPIALSIGADRHKEVLSYIEGDVAMRPWPACLLAKEGIIAVSQMLLKYHRLVVDYVPKPKSVWRVPSALWQEGMIIRHGDLGPWNIVWRSGELAGLIDWDFAEPGYIAEDLAQAAWDCVPLYPPEKSIQAGVAPTEQMPRLKTFCRSYGADVDVVIDAVAEMQEKEFLRIEGLGKVAKEPWRTLLQKGGLDEIADASQWLHEVYKPNVGRILPK